MLVKLNHLRGKTAGASVQDVVGTVYGLLDEGHIDASRFARVQVELDWIQYKQNFREVVTATRCHSMNGEPSPIVDIHVDTRQMTNGCLPARFRNVLARLAPGAKEEEPGVLLEDFQSLRTSLVWEFNKFYWTHLSEWESATGKGFEAALPGGQSEALHPGIIADSVGDFWTLLSDLEAKQQLPAEIFLLEIGVGTGKRCGLWLDGFRELDARRQTNYYPRLRVLLGDYSLDTLDMSKPAVGDHATLCSFLVLDALNPLKSLSFLRHKVMYIHSTNVYDNLPDEELVRRGGRLYLVQVRAYVPQDEAARIGAAFDLAPEKISHAVRRLLGGGRGEFEDDARRVAFWREIWNAIRLEERLVCLDDLPEFPFPGGLDTPRLEEALGEVPSDLRFHLSSGALESMSNTLPLLHPRGYLQVHDIFVTDLEQYRVGFYGPGKLDGSLLNWVNGALLKEVAERAGYDLHFVPFHYREGSRTSILYTTHRA